MPATIIDQLSGREVLAGPEEVNATQELIYYLTQRLGWNPQQIMAHPQWRVPKNPSGSRRAGYPVDLAIFHSADRVGDPDAVRIIAECKAPSVDEGLTQLKTYLSLEPEARLGIWFNGHEHRLVYKLPNGFSISQYGAIPRPTDPLTPTSTGTPLKWGDLVPPPSLADIFMRLRDRIAAQDSHVNRDEFILNDLANLLICKIVDEQRGEIDPERSLAFQHGGNPEATAFAMREFFKDVQRQLPSVFTDDADRLHIDDASLDDAVKSLEKYQLLGFDRHAVGTAFQVLRGRALKGEEGAYFTPPPLVDCAVQILQPDHSSVVIDPACGTGGFLAATLDYVFETIDARNITPDAKAAAKRNWASEKLYAIDKDVVSTKLCKAYLTLLGDGRAHVFRANTIDRSDWAGRDDQLGRDVRPGRFNMILTNPPFGQNLKVNADVARREALTTAKKWQKVGDTWVPTEQFSEQQLGVVFFERALELLEEGGKMAIVLPETFLFSSSFRWFVEWMCSTVTITHVIDIPMLAFEEYCRAKTCLLFVRKAPAPIGHRIIMSYPRSIGQDKRGQPVRKMGIAGRRDGELDNELLEATQKIVGRLYRGEARADNVAEDKTDSRLFFRVPQRDVRERGIVVPRFWWRQDAVRSLSDWQRKHASELVTLGELADAGILMTFEGHGSPPADARATGQVPYVKVTDLKNWRINENPTNFVHEDVANKLKKRGVALNYGDLLTPARASSNIGQFSLVLPWQTDVLLTREMLGLRVLPNNKRISPYLLLALLSLKVVQDQFKTLVLMQTNREHLGDHWREVIIPIPDNEPDRLEIENPVRAYFDSIVIARESWVTLSKIFDAEAFGTRP
ncbi:MAG: hypothetical protein JWR80_8970 [Bradyrhizobium sp.]|nr:hypothetical protein [Bradyrhizobium sp.]